VTRPDPIRTGHALRRRRIAEIYVGHAGFDLEALVAELVAGESVPFLAALCYTDSGLRKRSDWEATWDKQRAEDAIDAEVVAHRDEFVRAAWARMNPREEGEVAEVYAARMTAGLDAEDAQKAADALIAAEAKRRRQAEVGDIPCPLPMVRRRRFVRPSTAGPSITDRASAAQTA
jgi:hypothetical protein